MSTSEVSTACPHLITNPAGMCPRAGLAQQENTPTPGPEATPGTVTAALLGCPLTAVKAGHGFCCWLCHRECPDWQRMSLLAAGHPPQQGLREGAGQPGLFVVPKQGSQGSQPCCTGHRGEFMGHRVRICVLQPQAVTALSCHVLPELSQLGQ